MLCIRQFSYIMHICCVCIYTGPPHLCIVNFINDGVTVFNNGTVMLDFADSGPTSSFLCSMDYGALQPCMCT